MRELKQLYSAFFENLSGDPVTELNKGRVYWNTVADELRVYNGTTWVVFSNTDATPSGIIVPFGGIAAPTGYVECDGTAYDSIAFPIYADLYTAIQTTWGGTGPADFKVPDLRGGYLKGTGSNAQTTGGDVAALGDFQDDATELNGVTLGGSTSFASASHTHDQGSLYAAIQGTNNVGMIYRQVSVASWTDNRVLVATDDDPSGAPSSRTSGVDVLGNTGSPNTSGTVSISSSDNETRPKSYGVNYVIKV